MLIQTNKVLAPSNQLQVLKLLKRIEVEKRDGLTNAILHDWATAIIYIIMSTNLQLYKNLRVYRHLNFYEIINAIICNRVMKSRMLVAAAPALYKFACRFPGKAVTHFVVGNTFNRVFTGGNSLESVERSTFHLAERGKLVMTKESRSSLITAHRDTKTNLIHRKCWTKMQSSSDNLQQQQPS